MPLAGQHMRGLGEQIHVAVWPTVTEMHQIGGQTTTSAHLCRVIGFDC
jgi:hypothetical protein